MQQIITQLKQIAAQYPKGFTVLLPNLEPVSSGWIVAMKETQNCFGDSGLQKALEVATQTSNVIGGWKQGRKWYWDASIIFQNQEDAIQSAIENEQIALYHIDTNDLIFIDDYLGKLSK